MKSREKVEKWCFYFYVSTSFSLSLPLSLSLSLSFCLSLHFCPSVYLSVCQCVCLSVCLSLPSLYSSPSLCPCLSVCLSVSLSLSLSLYLAISLRHLPTQVRSSFIQKEKSFCVTLLHRSYHTKGERHCTTFLKSRERRQKKQEKIKMF